MTGVDKHSLQSHEDRGRTASIAGTEALECLVVVFSGH